MSRRAFWLGASGASRKDDMSEPDNGVPIREPSTVLVDDSVMPFAVEALDLRGRVVRLGPVVDSILRGHSYPQPVA
jgi:molecular chaperone Hsp33